MNKPEVELVILPSNFEPKYFFEVYIDGKTYEIKETIKELGFKWNGIRWVIYFNPFKEDPFSKIKEIVKKLSEVAELKIWSPSGKTLDEIISHVFERCKEWKRDYDIIRSKFIKVLKGLGFEHTIKALEEGELEVVPHTVKIKFNDKIISVPAAIVITNFIKNFKDVFNELKQLHYVYRSTFRCFEVRRKYVVK